MFERRSALALELAAGGRDGADGRRALRLTEVRGWSLVQLGVFAGQEAALAAIGGAIVGGPLPESARVVTATGRARLYRVAPDAFWILAADPGVPFALAAAVPADVGTVTPLSQGRVRVAIEGPSVRELLAEVCPIDLHPQAFRVGDFAQTGLHHVAVLLERPAADRYELTLLRTFAASGWQWLADAALRYGYDVGVEAPAAPAAAATHMNFAERDRT